VNALRAQKTKLVTSVDNPATFPAIAPTLLLRELAVEPADFKLVVVVEPRSATSAQRSATSLVTAQRQVDTVVVDLAVMPADMVAVAFLADARVARHATAVADTATCHVTVPKAKSATTVARLAISPGTAPRRPPASALAISASSPVTSRRNAPTKVTICTRAQQHTLRTILHIGEDAI